MTKPEFICPACMQDDDTDEPYTDEDPQSVYYHAMSVHEINIREEYAGWPKAYKENQEAHDTSTEINRQNVSEGTEKQEYSYEGNNRTADNRPGILGRIRRLFGR
jgi:hypothetical protein